MTPINRMLHEVKMTRLGMLYEDVVRIENLKDIPKGKLAKLLRYNGLNYRIVGSKFIKTKGDEHLFRVATSNDVNDMFATYNVSFKLDIKNMDIIVQMDAEPFEVFRKESEAKQAL